MLTEHFVASIAAPTKPNTGVTKDAGIFFHEFQPLAAQRHVYKKSATAQNCLAVSNSHIFAAQAEKAIVHVYSREKGNQEAIVPFPERIHSLALALKDTVLLLGTESGRVLLWEICSGRLVSTSTSHLQPVTVLVVDPASNFFLSGAADSMVHVWALPTILSFSPDTSRSPVHTLSTHRGPIVSLTCGHSSSRANIAISVSQDKSAIVWDYHNGQSLRTYLLPEAPSAVTLDPADRAFYVAYDDGSLQTISFYDEFQQPTPVDTVRDGSLSHRPLQPSAKTRFDAESQKLGGAMSLSLNWDGTILVSGHSSGKVAAWDIAKRTYISTLTSLPGPVTNLQFLSPTGFPNAKEETFKIHAAVKPKQDTGMNMGANGLAPTNYNLSMQFTGHVSIPPISAAETRRSGRDEFEEALTHPSFPMSMLEESLAGLANWNVSSNSKVEAAADFMSLPVIGANEDASGAKETLGGAQEEELKELKKQLASLQRIQKVTFAQLAELREEKEWFVNREKKQADRKAQSKHGLPNGNSNDDVEMSEAEDDSGSGLSESESNDEGSGSDEEEKSSDNSE